MAVKGKGKQIAGKSSASSESSSGKRKNIVADSESSGIRPKKKRPGVRQFVDDVAEDADFDIEEEEEDDLEWEADDDFEFELPDIGAKEVKNVAKVPGKTNHAPFFIKEEEMDDDELEEAIKERYRGSGLVSFDEDIKEFNAPHMETHVTKDHSIWRVKSMIGRERQAAFCLMQKFVDLQKIGKKLLIFSVFSLDHVKGFVYIEADKVCNVFEACNGLCILYPSKVELVPINEAPNLLSIQKKGCAISKGTWVRMKNGKYKGDLAEVVSVNDEKKRVTIKLVPRIDLQAISKKFGGGTSLKASAIPAPRLINSRELEDFRPHIEIRRDRETGEIFEILDGLMLKDGYLYKKVSVCSLIHWGVQPTSAELSKFEDMGKDEVQDVSWLSSIYKEPLKKKLPEPSNPKNGDKSNPKDGNKQINGFDLDDLVLFGKKGCGIIVDKENDTFKVLKGGENGSEVVTISVREIKRNCIDKVFTATDRHMKTISIDDVVKVLEGPLEGKEGIVRHMYRGFLFLYDECQSENNGFICAKSEICELVKKSRRFGAGKSGSKAGASFAQSPIISSEQDEDSQTFSRNRQSTNRGTFSVGQTLRIRQGPLKGYLCRVIRIYRADVTVKLDSLGKLLTVDEKLLSFPISKRDDDAAVQSDMFGSQDDQSLVDDGRGVGLDSCELNAGIPSFGRDSWNAPSSSSFSFPRDHDSKDENQGADPWGSKLTPLDGDKTQGADQWESKPSLLNGDKNQVADSWGSKLSSLNEDENQGTDPWGSKPSPLNKDQGKEAASCWGAAPIISADSSWDKMGEEKGVWNIASTKSETSADGWQSFNPSKKSGQTSNMKGSSNDWAGVGNATVESVNAVDGWSKIVPNPGQAQTSGEDDWNKAASKGQTISKAETGGWEKTKLPSSDSGGSWNTKGVTSDWNKETRGNEKAEGLGGQSGEDDWNKAASKGPTISKAETGGWEKTKLPSSDSGGSWNTKGVTSDWNKETSGNEKAEGFGSQSGNWASSKSGGDNQDSWDVKGKGLPKNSNSWGQSVEKKTDASTAWKSPSTDQNQAASWGTSASSQDHAGQGMSNPNNSDWGQGSGWSQGTSGNENGKNWGQGNNWNQQRDFDGERGSNRGRGRGRYGGRGGRNEDSSTRPGDSDGDWGSGRGGGRGRNGAGGYNRDNNSDSREFGRGRGRGRGRGQDQGKFESSDWRNKQESFDNGGFSNKPSSSWGATEGSSWTKSKVDEKEGWNSGSQKDMNVSSVEQTDDWNTKTDNWTTKTSDNKTSSWNQTTSNAAEGESKASSSDDKWMEKKSSEKSNSDNWAQASAPDKEKEAQGDWTRSENKSNWGNRKESGTVDASGSSKGWGSNSVNSDSNDWSGARKDSFSQQSSDWNNGGNKWNKQSEGQGNSESWSSGSDRGRGGRGRYNSFGSGRGRDNSFASGERENSFSGGGRDFNRGGGRGRDNSFSGRGRGRGRNSDGFYGRNRDDGNDRGQSFNSNQEYKNGGSWSREQSTFEGEKSSWNSSGNAGKGSFSSWKSDGENQPGSWANPGSGWASSEIKPDGTDGDKLGSWGGKRSSSNAAVDSSMGGWEKTDMPSEKSTGNDKPGGGWGDGDSNKPGSWDGKGTTLNASTDSTRGGWEKTNMPPEKSMEKDKTGGGWGAGHSIKPGSWDGKGASSNAGTRGGWEKTDMPSEKSAGNDKPGGGWGAGDSIKPGSWDGKGASSNAGTDSIRGGWEKTDIPLEKSTGSDKPGGGWGAGDSIKPGSWDGKGESSNAGTRGGWEKTDMPSEKSTGNDKPGGRWGDGGSDKPGSWSGKGSSLNATADSTKSDGQCESGWEKTEMSLEKSTGNDKPGGGWGDGVSNNKPGSWDGNTTTGSTSQNAVRVAGQHDAAPQQTDTIPEPDNSGPWGKGGDSWGKSGNGGNSGW